jgi:predicted flap endonuclease-1-like 5' DNA nuclease
MLNVAENNLVLLVIVLVIGVAVALWVFRGRGGRSDGPEGNALPDEFAAATQDVAGEILGVDAHPTIAGPSGPPDNLQRLKGVGPKLAAQLNEFGITRFDQLAGLTENEVALLDKRMGAFEGRIARDRLVEQACYLERGDIDGFEAKFGKLGGA